MRTCVALAVVWLGASSLAAPARGETPPPAKKVLYSQQHDIDGDGQLETVTVTSEAIIVGARSLPLEKMTKQDVAHMAAGDTDVRVRILDFNPKKPGKQIVLEARGMEDSTSWHVYVYKRQKLHFAGVVSSASRIEVKDKVVVQADDNCGLRRRTYWALRKNKLVVLRKTKTGTYNSMLCAACPFVYAGRGDDELRRQGEILHRLNRRELAGEQRLPLRRVGRCGTRVWVSLAEEKAETTYLDAVFLSVDGQRFRPVGCIDGSNSYCDADGRYFALNPGHDVRLEFVLPEHLACTPAALVASGFYLPDKLSDDVQTD